MKSSFRIALGAALLLGSASFVAAPAAAKKPAPAAAPADPSQRQLKFSKEERAALLPVQTAVAAKDWATATAALSAAQGKMTSADGKYAIGRFQFDIGRESQNVALQSQGLDNMIASGWANPQDLVVLYESQGIIASNAGDSRKAETAFTRLVELSPNNTQAMVNLAKTKVDLKKPQEATALLERAIAATKAAGQKADESWYKYALKLAFEGRQGPTSIRLSRELIAAYPTKENWRDALLIYRDLNTLDRGAALDLLRLGRISKALAGERDWFELAETLTDNGLPAEAKAVLQEGASMRMLDLNKPAFRDLLKVAEGRMAGDRASLGADETKAMAAANGTLAMKVADAYIGYGELAKAAALYRAAIAKGSVDANVANTRLGIALAMAGNKAEAEAAFRAVTGPRAELAAFWLAWLAQRS